MAEPAADTPEPAAQIFQVVHLLRPSTAVNVPVSHAAHTRLLLAVAAKVMYEPLAHSALTFSQVVPLATSE